MELNAAIDGRMDNDATGEGLVGVVGQLEFHAQLARDLVEIVGRGLDGGEAARALEAVTCHS